MQRRLTKQKLTIRQRLLSLIVASGAIFASSECLVAQQVASLPVHFDIQVKPVGVGVLMPSPLASGPEFEIAKRPWFWDRLTGTEEEATNQLQPPAPPLVSNPSKMSPPSAVWTPPKPSDSAAGGRVVVPNPKQVPQPNSTTDTQGDGWTQRGAAENNGLTITQPNRQLIVGSGLAPQTDSSQSIGGNGGLEPATSVIRLLPVTTADSVEMAEDREPQADLGAASTPSNASDSSVVILKAPQSSATESSRLNNESAATDSLLDDSVASPAQTASQSSDSSKHSHKRIASANEDPIPLRDPADLHEAGKSDSRGSVSAAVDSKDRSTKEPVHYQMQDQADALAAGAESPSNRDAENVESAESKIVVREVKINRDGSPTTDDSVSREVGLAQDGSMSDASDSQDLVTKKDVAEVEVTPLAMEPVEAISNLDYIGYPRIPMELSSSVRQMQGAMSQCLKYYFGKPESADVRSNWGMLHSIMVWGVDTPILAGNSQYNAIAWIAGNNLCAGKPLLIQENGRMVATTGVGLQGHQAQFLAVLALCDIPSDYPLYAGNTRYTIDDLVKEEMLACRSGEELTFSLIGLSHYLDTDTRWTNAQGETWDIPRLIREEMSQPIVGSACGGTHRLMGFAHALRKRRIEGREISGQWKRAELYTDDFVQYVFKLQNRDGSMSTDWFEGREDNGSMDRKVQTTGHMVEWLLSVLPDSQLQDPRLVSSVRYLTNAMNQNRAHEWKIGPKGHALRALAMYYQRVYQEGPAWQSLIVAQQDAESRR